MRNEIYPEVLKARKLSKIEIELLYRPEFIALGNVVANLQEPEFILLGSDSGNASSRVIEQLRLINKNNATIHQVTFESAEIAKIAVNTYLTTKISYANMLSSLILRTPRASNNQVFEVLRNDSRIGTKFFTPGLSYGGPCLPRDNRALMAYGLSKSLETPIAEATDKVNQSRLDFILNEIKHFIQGCSRVLVLGVTYKPSTSSIEESQAFEIAKRIVEMPVSTTVHDFFVNNEQIGIQSPQIISGPIPPLSDFDAVIGLVADLRYVAAVQDNPHIPFFSAFDLTEMKYDFLN
jgi:UDPglucose 6-dehydrogenase